MLTKANFDTQFTNLTSKMKDPQLTEVRDAWAPIQEHVDKYEAKKKPESLVKAADALYAARTDTMKNKPIHNRLLFWLVDQLDESLVAGVTENSGHIMSDVNTMFIADTKTKLFELSKFACDDVERWAGNINGSRGGYYADSMVRNRAWRRKTDEAFNKPLNDAKGASNCQPISKKVYRLSEYTGTFTGIYNTTKKAKSGICTTYGFAAAAIMMADQTKNKKNTRLTRIEVVGWKRGHVYSIVNREGDIDDPRTWGAGVFQVDPWLGSLGHPYIFKGVTSYNRGFLDDIEVLFDSTHEMQR